jgi:hypothetical protein
MYRLIYAPSQVAWDSSVYLEQVPNLKQKIEKFDGKPVPLTDVELAKLTNQQKKHTRTGTGNSRLEDS